MNPDSLKRLIVFTLSGAALFLAPKLGIPLDPHQAVAFAGLAATFLIQSGLKSAAQHLSESTSAAALMKQLASAKAAFDQAKAAGAVPPTPPAAS